MAVNDFNPLDLSAYTPQQPVEQAKTKLQKPKPQKAVVRRVGIGPVLHSRFTKIFVFLGFLFFVSVGSYAATLWWLTNR